MERGCESIKLLPPISIPRLSIRLRIHVIHKGLRKCDDGKVITFLEERRYIVDLFLYLRIWSSFFVPLGRYRYIIYMINTNKGNPSKKALAKRMLLSSPHSGRKNSRQFRRDTATLKYITKMDASSKFTKRTIAALSPWNTRMIKVILQKDFVDISSALKEILQTGTTFDKIQKAFTYSSIFERLAKMDYYN